MNFVEAYGRLINVDDITEISLEGLPGEQKIRIEKKNGKEITFPVLNRAVRR